MKELEEASITVAHIYGHASPKIHYFQTTKGKYYEPAK